MPWKHVIIILMDSEVVAAGLWPTTPWDMIRTARLGPDGQRRAVLESLLALYYVPVHRFFARALSARDGEADDVTHDLFAKLLERDLIQGLPHETSLRGFLKVACRRQYANRRASEAAERRALRAAAALEIADDAAIDAAVDEELRRFYVEEAMRRTRQDLVRRGKEDLVAMFEARVRFDGARPDDYAAIAERFGVRVYDVQNGLALARKVFRRELLRVVAERAEDPRTELRELGLERFTARAT